MKSAGERLPRTYAVDTKWTPELSNMEGAVRMTPFRRMIPLRKSGAGEGIRTLDPNLGKVVLYP